MQAERRRTGAKYGPPPVKRRGYSTALEMMESRSNKGLIAEYEEDILQQLSILEANNRPNPAMIDLQPEIQWFMRPFLLDFLIELHSSFRLQPQTLFLCLDIVDRYCAKRIVFKRHYQLVGCTALWIAGKYEDKKSRVPTLRELAMMCRNAYDEEMFVQMEMHIMSTLDWSLGHSNLEECLQLAISFSNQSRLSPFKYNVIKECFPNSNASKISAITAVGRFLCEISLYDRFFLTVSPSIISFTANLLACSMLQITDASNALHKLMTSHRERSQFLNSCYNEDRENERPLPDGPFLGGFDEYSLDTIRKTCLMFIIQLGKVSEVLSKKYEEYGVIQVVKNFNTRYSYAITVIYENQQSFQDLAIEDIRDSKICSVADSLLQISNASSEVESESHVPLTPPSATSQYSVFSHKNLTPSCVTPASSYIPSSERMDDFSPMDGSQCNTWSSPAASAKTYI